MEENKKEYIFTYEEIGKLLEAIYPTLQEAVDTYRVCMRCYDIADESLILNDVNCLKRAIAGIQNSLAGQLNKVLKNKRFVTLENTRDVVMQLIKEK